MTKHERSESIAQEDRALEVEVTLEARAARARLQTASFLSAGLAHEISNPLTSLLHSLAEAERICGALDSAPDASDSAYVVALCGHVADANVSGKAIGNLLRDFRMFLQTDRAIVPALVEPRPLVERAIRIAQPQIRSVARLSFSAIETPPVRATTSAVTQIVLNLLLNAAEALGGSGGKNSLIEVRLSVEPGQVVIEVTDNGRGIDAESLERIFSPHVTSKSAEGALGFGLPLCRALARRFGGDLSARSVPGWLTSFRLSLPIAES